MKNHLEGCTSYKFPAILGLHHPLKMAETILGLQGVTRAEIDSITASGKRKVIKLDAPIPVHVVYLTAWVNKDGSIHYRRDVYGRDEILAEALVADS